MKLPVHFIDAFTDTVFRGNPAAVVITEYWLNDQVMQNIATENNLSETAFLVPTTNEVYRIRWFSPIKEIDFCGHASLAAAFVLFAQTPALSSLTLNAKAVGDIYIHKLDNGSIQMSFPNQMPEKLAQAPKDLLAGLSIPPHEIYRNQQAYFVVYPDEQNVVDVQCDLAMITRLAPYDVVVTAASTRYDFVSRYFWPANGGAEDPVTGSIHAGLTPLWAEKLQKTQLSAYQASTRGGHLNCVLNKDRVLVSGKAVRYLEGTIEIAS